jgi:lysophospholipase L1-like esterase
MRPLAVVNRGFGGAHAAHVTHYAPRIVFPHQPRAIVLYAGDNDLGRLSPRSTGSVVEDFRGFVSDVRGKLGKIPIYVLSIKPTPLRARQWPRMERANRGIAALASDDGNVHFIDVASPMLDERGRPRRELYRWDGLHLNDAGYRLWAGIVKPRLVADLGR